MSTWPWEESTWSAVCVVIGMTKTKPVPLVASVVDSKQNQANFFPLFLTVWSLLQLAQVPMSPDLDVFMPTQDNDRHTNRSLYTICACVQGNQKTKAIENCY